MKEKMINYPTQEWVDEWIDKWLDKNPNIAVSDFAELEEQAKTEWWDKEVEKGNPTPYDLTKAQEKVSKDARMGAKNHEFVKRKEPVKRERKPNEEKQAIIDDLYGHLSTLTWIDSYTCENPEREISFRIGENSYSITLTCHRKPKT